MFLYTYLFSVCLNANINTKILVKIDNELITNYDIKSKIITTLILSKKEINQKNIDVLKKASLDHLIQIRLKKIELKKYNIKKDEIKINSYLNSVSSNDVVSLKNLFEKNDLDFQVFIDEIDTEFRWRNLIYQRYSNKIEIDPEDINQEIKNEIQNQNDLIEYNLSEIEILSNSDSFNEQNISQIQDEIKNYGFESAVIKFSISSTSTNKGALGWISYNSLSNDFLKILNKMKIGEISKPIKKQNRIIILKLNDKKITNYSNININSLKKKLIDQKKNELFNLYSDSYLSKLRNTQFIEYYK